MVASPGEVVCVLAVAAMAAGLVAIPIRGTRARGSLVAWAVMLVLVTGVAWTMLRPSLRAEGALPPDRPGPGTTAGYVSSRACLGCHPGEHASFSRTFHQTMTQVATPGAVRAPLDGRALPLDDRVVRLERRGEEIWATLPDPDAAKGQRAEDVTRRVVLTTGSHREQAFWVAGQRRGDLRLVPYVWLMKDAAFVPRREAFLTPPGDPLPAVRWGSNCIACHAVAGEPKHDEMHDAFDTRVAELGVACEACHGPGAAHVERHRDPVERFAQRSSGRVDPTIVQPAKLSPERSAAVCGQCHAYAFPRDEAGWWTDGYARSFRAGDLLSSSRTLIEKRDLDPSTASPTAPAIDAPASAIFWPDGGVRVGGREYNGLVASPCYERGQGARKMTCLSCHAMHEGDPSGQIAPSRAGDSGCTSCHDSERSRSHSHHAAGSPGSACVSCHMPKTSYALLQAVRSHRIESPSAANEAATGKPNACNLCHLDRSLAWTSRWLTAWYGAAPIALAGDRVRAAAGLFDGLAGDAGVRALIADALGAPGAAPAPGFRAALLDEMRRDPYAAVRFIAARSLRTASVDGRVPDSAEDRQALALGPDGRLDPDRLRALLAARDVRRVTIAE